MRKERNYYYQRVFMALALAVCCMNFVSCSKDEEVTTPPLKLEIALKDAKELDAGVGRVDLDIKANSAWGLSIIYGDDVKPWLFPHLTRGNGDYVLQIDVNPNSEVTARQAMLRVFLDKDSTITKEIQVVQAGCPLSLSVKPGTIRLKAFGKLTEQLAIDSNTDWTMTTEAEWLHLSAESGKGKAFVTLEADENMSTEGMRTATVVVASPMLKDSSVVLKVEQNSLAEDIYATPYISWRDSKDKVKTGVANQTILSESDSELLCEGRYLETATLYAFDNQKLRYAIVTVNKSKTSEEAIRKRIQDEGYSLSDNSSEKYLAFFSKDWTSVTLMESTDKQQYGIVYADYRLFYLPSYSIFSISTTAASMKSHGYTLLSSSNSQLIYAGKYRESLIIYSISTGQNNVAVLLDTDETDFSELGRYLVSELSYKTSSAGYYLSNQSDAIFYEDYSYVVAVYLYSSGDKSYIVAQWFSKSQISSNRIAAVDHSDIELPMLMKK